LVDILKASGVSEIAVEYGDTKIQVKRATPAQVTSVVAGEEPIAETTEREESASQPPAPLVIKAVRVGIFHRGEKAEGEPLVEVGKNVQSGQTIAYIESVKLMTEVIAPKAATVSNILVEDGAPVEYGQPLFELEPDINEEIEEEEE
jgi:acetyl-CoA carboxylase biotin carboxyl carrier protein